MSKKANIPSPVVRQAVEGTVYRADDNISVTIEDEEERIVLLSFSSELPYTRVTWWDDPWIEVVGHEDGEMDLYRLNNGAVVLYNHMRTRADRIGAVKEAWIDEGRGFARIQISKRDDVDDIWIDLKDSLLTNVSYGYKILERVLMKQNEDGPDEYRVTKSEPLEISLVDIPADPTIGVGREADRDHAYRVIDLDGGPPPAAARTETGDIDMSGRKDDTPAKNESGDDNQPPGITAADVKKAEQEAADRALAEEDARREDINDAFEFAPQTDEIRKLKEACLADRSIDANQARKDLLETMGKDKKPAGTGAFQPGEDRADKFRDACLNAIYSRAAVPGVDVDPQNELRGYTLAELARASLSFHGLDTGGSRIDMIGRALTMRSSGIGLSVSDFPNLLADVANKSVKRGYDEAGETWSPWCRVGNLTDFRAARRAGLSAFDDLTLVGEGGEYGYGKFTDDGETIQLGTYGKIFPITRQAIINDDLMQLTSAPAKMGRAAARVPGDLAYAVLTVNGNMSDGVALFAGGHNNLGTGAALSAASIGEARNLMALQTDANSGANGLNIQLGYILVPVQLRDTAQVLATSEFDPAATNNSRAPNPVRGDFEVIADPRLSADDAAQWYAIAGSQYDTVEVAFLDGNQSPRVEEKSGWTVDGVEYKVALDCAAAAIEYRTMVRNAGS